MKEIDKYLDTLKLYAKRKIQGYINNKIVKLNDFETVNSYIINQAINKSQNILIKIPNREFKNDFYIPVIITVSLFNFLKNYIGTTLLRKHRYYTLKEIYEESIILIDNMNNRTLKIKKRDIRTFLVPAHRNPYLTALNIENNEELTKYEYYKEIFNKILINIPKSAFPTVFQFKTIIVTDKKIVEGLKKYRINNKLINKAFPFRYISKSGNYTDNLPFDPMIYIVNDYTTVREHIFTKNIKIKNIIFIGANKYRDYETCIANDLSYKKYENIIFIGSYDIIENSISNLIKWKWTLPELYYFKYIETKEVKIKTVTNEVFEEKLKEFDVLIKNIEKTYNISLQKLYLYVKRILPIVIPNQNSRLTKQLDNLLDYFQKEAQDFIENEFFEIGEYDYEEIWRKIFEKYKSLIEYKKNDFSKYKSLNMMNNINYLVVPKEYIDIWEEELNIKHIISFNDFKELKKKYNQREFEKPNIVFLGFYGYNHLKEIIYSDFEITLLLYPIEEQSYKKVKDKLKQETYNYIRESDRKKISEISFTQIKSEETVSELLQRLFNKNTDNSFKDYDYSARNENLLSYEIVFEDGEILILEENKTVLLKTKENERPEKIRNLKENDQIRVYENTTKEDLYKIALEADTEGEFQKIDELSKLWKSLLREYSLRFNSLNDLLIHLNKKGLSITNELTLKNWINIDSNLKFPQKRKDLNVLRKAISNQIFDDNFNRILDARTKYNGAMIALGRDLSDEVSEFIKTQKKGELLKRLSDDQIREMINQNAPLKTVKSIKLKNYED